MKKCFVITPIGDEMSDIRRHIDGIIDAAIKPALEKQYDVIAAHHIELPGNITKQVIKEIYESDLVIANLTDRNPNVMYELAVRHCIGSPSIMIAEQSTSLPSDIISERTIFYRNDARGVIELKEKLKKAVEEIKVEGANEKLGPVYDVLSNIFKDNKIVQAFETEDIGDTNPLKLVLERLDDLDQKLTNRRSNSQNAYIEPRRLSQEFEEVTINIRFEEPLKINTFLRKNIEKAVRRYLPDAEFILKNDLIRIISNARIPYTRFDAIKSEIKNVCVKNEALPSCIEIWNGNNLLMTDSNTTECF